ncbi:unnamed protein product [Durusdinium trenchii]|uniref:Ion transport domain-containing protein n=1 Tax=Durusdinium trenchii TaxID=1381693 RepID=A0ABP0PJ99_9DINO
MAANFQFPVQQTTGNHLAYKSHVKNLCVDIVQSDEKPCSVSEDCSALTDYECWQLYDSKVQEVPGGVEMQLDGHISWMSFIGCGEGTCPWCTNYRSCVGPMVETNSLEVLAGNCIIWEYNTQGSADAFEIFVGAFNTSQLLNSSLQRGDLRLDWSYGQLAFPSDDLVFLRLFLASYDASGGGLVGATLRVRYLRTAPCLDAETLLAGPPASTTSSTVVTSSSTSSYTSSSTSFTDTSSSSSSSSTTSTSSTSSSSSSSTASSSSTSSSSTNSRSTTSQRLTSSSTTSTVSSTSTTRPGSGAAQAAECSTGISDFLLVVLALGAFFLLLLLTALCRREAPNSSKAVVPEGKLEVLMQVLRSFGLEDSEDLKAELEAANVFRKELEEMRRQLKAAEATEAELTSLRQQHFALQHRLMNETRLREELSRCMDSLPSPQGGRPREMNNGTLACLGVYDHITVGNAEDHEVRLLAKEAAEAFDCCDQVVVDCRGHLLGRLASVLAKEPRKRGASREGPAERFAWPIGAPERAERGVRAGSPGARRSAGGLKRSTLHMMRAEDINISGSLYRNKLKYANFKRKHMNTNPRQGPFHFRSPAKILWRTVRGMVPHKTARGAAALDKLKTFEGIPHPYDRKKRMVVPGCPAAAAMPAMIQIVGHERLSPSCLKVLRLRPERRFCRLGDLSKEVGWKHGALIQRLESQRKVKSEAFYKKKARESEGLDPQNILLEGDAATHRQRTKAPLRPDRDARGFVMVRCGEPPENDPRGGALAAVKLSSDEQKVLEAAGGASPPSSARNVPAAPGTALAGALPEAFPVAFWGWPTWVKRRSGGGKSYCINSKRRPGGATGGDLRGMLLDEELEKQSTRLEHLEKIEASAKLERVDSDYGAHSAAITFTGMKSYAIPAQDNSRKFLSTARQGVSRMFRSERSNSQTDVPLTAQPCYVINPDGCFYRRIWHSIMLSASVYVALITPVQAFALGMMEVSFFLVLGFAIDVAFIADLIFTFFVQIQVQTATGVKRESSLSRIAMNYIMGWFFCDLLVVMPFDLIGFFLGVAGERAIRLLWMSKVLRLVKPSRLFAMIRVPYSIQHQQQWMLLRFLGFLLLLCHWFACLWCLALPLIDQEVPKWIDDQNGLRLELQGRPLNLVETYMWAFYFCSYTMTSVGYGDIGPKNELEVALCTSMVICTGFGWAYVLGQICAIVADINEDSQAFRMRMHHPNLMMDKERLPEQLRQRLRNFFLQNRTLAQHLNNQELLNSMSPQLQSEVCFASNLEWLRKVSFFDDFIRHFEKMERSGMPVQAYHGCIAEVARRLECIAFAQEEHFETAQVLCILSKGLCIINTQLQRKGDVWGEDFVLSDRSLVRSKRCHAMTYIEVLNLSRKALMEIIDDKRFICPKFGEIIHAFRRRLAAQRAILLEAKRRRKNESPRGHTVQPL